LFQYDEEDIDEDDDEDPRGEFKFSDIIQNPKMQVCTSNYVYGNLCWFL